MDNLTHTLFGLTLAQTSLRRAGPGVTATLVLASNAPDIDIVKAIMSGSLAYIDVHRGPTHGPIGIVSLGLLTASLVRLIWSKGDLAKLFLVATLGVLFHVLMDLPTSYGTRLLSPFSSTWYALDWLPIIDVYLLALLAIGLGAIFWKPGARDTITRAVFLLMMGNYLLHAATQQMALRRQEATGSERCNLPALRSWGPAIGTPELACETSAVIPTFTSPFRWRLVRKVPDGYELSEIDLLSGTADPPVRFPETRNQAVELSRQADNVETFFRFARFPAVRAEHSRSGTDLVFWTDLRFARGLITLDPESVGPQTPFVVWVRLNEAGEVIDEYPRRVAE